MRTSFMTLAAVVLASVFAAAQYVYVASKDPVTQPVLTKRVEPRYTEGAMRRRVEGIVKLNIVVTAEGTVRDDVKVTQSLDEELDQQAIIAVKQWEFKPGTKDGVAVAVRVNVELAFKLK